MVILHILHILHSITTHHMPFYAINQALSILICLKRITRRTTRAKGNNFFTSFKQVLHSKYQIAGIWQQVPDSRYLLVGILYQQSYNKKGRKYQVAGILILEEFWMPGMRRLLWQFSCDSLFGQVSQSERTRQKGLGNFAISNLAMDLIQFTRTSRRTARRIVSYTRRQVPVTHAINN